MSDPVSNIEIEDVLSSIRRLVSEETGSQPRPDPVRHPQQENRLVLTPALRVADEVAEVAVSVEPEASPEIEDDTPWSKPGSTLYTAAQIEPETSIEPEAMEEALLVVPDDTDLLHTDALDEADAVDDAPADEVYVMTDEVLHEDAPIPEAELDSGGDDDASVQDVSDQDSDDAQQDDMEMSTDPQQHEDEPSKDVDLDNLTPFSAKIAALETAIGETQDQWEPDGMAGDDYAGTPVRTLQWQDHEAEETDSSEASEDVEAEAVEPESSPIAPEPEADTEEEDANQLDFLVGDDSLMDEESLRELVADIVREELQGALGERITRNVRKLVRREIHRALTTQQLD